MHYLDNAATTRPSAAVMETVHEMLAQNWGNPSSLYGLGATAEAAMQAARRQVAAAMGCAAKAIVFTSGGTEGNNLALWGAAMARRGWANHIVTTGYEHPSVDAPLALLEKEGFAITRVPPDATGQVQAEEMIDAVTEKTALVAVIHVNNENGAVLDVEAIARAVKAKNSRCFVHVDGVQAFGKLPLALANSAIDAYAVSGHKLHAPKGVGALYLRPGAHLTPLYAGGGQEQNVRPGTENTAFIAALGTAAQQATQQMDAAAAHMAALRARLLSGLKALGGVTVHSPPSAWCGTVIFSMPRGLRSQVMLNLLDEGYGVCVSSGSACAGGAASHTLTAMGLPAHQIDAALRVSFCGESTTADVDALLAGLRECVQRLARR